MLLLGTIFEPLVQAKDERVIVRVDGRAVLRVGPLADLDPQTRARRIETRSAVLLQNPQAIAPAVIDPPITADPQDTRERSISVSDVQIVTVTQTDAEDNLLPTTSALATQWSSAIDTALGLASERSQTGWGRFTAEVRGSAENAAILSNH